ncbi:FAD-dependent oxidoreductase [Halalkalibacter akibai]|uniref:FAD/NAD(P)-binding domain-containing protein n=1 Tax=Halalkalibacter akibai (strain ATCC 43226 / DSM 21942 / CIP 109018 / JCM 9157 / 1139) TaxID=1236973 RepID=W4QXW1_HALA3|nr:FAD/NAD(P)-binding protein [Halalkalibacter akibai]GAE36478.1 hypothetical protein JCM9157_3667 [Halalkalibacter akibai JCM 9157]
MVEWTIIGGGIQGCTLANYLIKTNRTTISNLVIIDPNPEPLFTWKKCTKTIEMPFLRSPSIHHLDLDPFSLEKFAKSEEGNRLTQFYGRYDRPSLVLFNKHCDVLFNEIQLEKSWNQGRVEQLVKVKQNWLIKLSDGREFESKNVVLAMGVSENPNWPEWANQLVNEGANVHHIYDNAVNTDNNSMDNMVILGGGISAVHTALKWSKRRPGKVRLVTRHPFRLHQFDSDPGWLGPKKMNSFRKVTCLNKRRHLIINARHKGSIPQELKAKVLKEEKDGRLEIIVDEISNATYSNGEINLKLKNTKIVTNQILLATGFNPAPPGFNWLTSIIKSEGLLCAACGYPIVSEKTLEWKDKLFVIGALAELAVGPVSRNISGARRGAERIVQL